MLTSTDHPAIRSGSEKQKATQPRGLSRIFGWQGLSRAIPSPVTQLQVFLNLPPFVTVFLCFSGTVFRFAEGMFRVSDDFTDGICGFAHSEVTFRRMSRQLVGCQGEALNQPQIKQQSFPPC